VATKLRELTPADHAAVTALWRASEGVGLGPDDGEMELAAFLARNPGLSLVALDEAGARLVGAALCGHDGRRGHIYHLAVAASHRRGGLGRAIVAACLTGLERQGIHRAQVSVFATNDAAKAFWARMGGQLRVDLAVFSLPLRP
jgi:N-acetylglutamate synthase